MVSGYFGVPGCGKSTMLTKFAQKELRRIRAGKSPYDHVLTNFYCAGCEKIDFSDLGKYKMFNCLILLDELTLDSDSRDYKSFSLSTKKFFTLHRHLHCDIIYFVQDFSRVDKTIRNVTYDLWYVQRSVVPFFKNFCKARRIFRNVVINEFTGELIMGYRFSKFLERIFTKTVRITWLPKWFKYFDSYDCSDFDELTEYVYIPWDSVLEHLPKDVIASGSVPILHKK